MNSDTIDSKASPTRNSSQEFQSWVTPEALGLRQQKDSALSAEPKVPGPKKRTPGNRLFDLAVYPTIAFGAVFAFSVWATEKSMFSTGKVRNAFESLAAAIQKTPVLKKLPAEEGFKKAKGHAMVLVSFFAGSLIIAPIKLFENVREPVSKFFDRIMKTTPEDPSQYANEPKQSWLSVLGGRAVTFGSVLLVGLSIGSHITNGSAKLASKITGEIPAGMKPELASKKWQRAYIASFEAFYTALCAGMVYVLSRTFARGLNKRASAQEPQATASPASGAPATVTAAEQLDTSKPLHAAVAGGRSIKPVEKAASFTQAVGNSRENTLQHAL